MDLFEKVEKGLQIEKECVSRDCDRNCGICDLVQDRDWLLSVYDDAIALIRLQNAQKAKKTAVYNSLMQIALLAMANDMENAIPIPKNLFEDILDVLEEDQQTAEEKHGEDI